jgi:hypothetical protein
MPRRGSMIELKRQRQINAITLHFISHSHRRGLASLLRISLVFIGNLVGFIRRTPPKYTSSRCNNV